MCFALFMAMLDNTVVNVALPKIQSSLGSGVSGLQWIVDAYVLMFASLMLTGGTLGDIFGRRRMFLAGLTIFTAASFLCGIAPNLTFFAETDSPNLFKSTTAGTKNNVSTIILQDAYVNYKFNDAFSLDEEAL